MSGGNSYLFFDESLFRAVAHGLPRPVPDFTKRNMTPQDNRVMAAQDNRVMTAQDNRTMTVIEE